MERGISILFLRSTRSLPRYSAAAVYSGMPCRSDRAGSKVVAQPCCPMRTGRSRDSSGTDRIADAADEAGTTAAGYALGCAYFVRSSERHGELLRPWRVYGLIGWVAVAQDYACSSDWGVELQVPVA